MRAWLTSALLVAVLAPLARAQETRRQEVHVSGVSGRSVYFDEGSAAGLAVGQEVELLPAGSVPYRVTIVSVARNSSRAEVPLDRRLPDPGTLGTVTVELSDDAPTDSAPRRARSHPGWTAPKPSQDTDTPLLAPAFGGGAASRPTEWNGRIFGQLEYDRSDGGGGANSWFLGQVGARVAVENPFGAGGRFAFDGDLIRRGQSLFQSGDQSEDFTQLDRLSYAFGDDQAEDWRVEVGRFTSRYSSQIGVIDGVEVLRRLSDEWGLGGGFGALPLPFSPRSNDGDVGAHLFATWRAPTERYLAATLGFQKTWHEGAADRDLLFGRFDWDIANPLRLTSSFKVDFYTGKDDLKDSGAELTEGFIDLGSRPLATLDVGVTASRFMWAQLLRDEFNNLPPDLIQNGFVNRASARLGWRFVDNWKVSGRLDAWNDQIRSGTSGELRVDGWGLFDGDTDLSMALFSVAGDFLSGPGVRFRVDHAFGDARIALRYELLRYERDDMISGPVTLSNQRAGLNLDWMLGPSWNLLAHGDVVFGDGENGYQLGTFVQYRF